MVRVIESVFLCRNSADVRRHSAADGLHSSRSVSDSAAGEHLLRGAVWLHWADTNDNQRSTNVPTSLCYIPWTVRSVRSLLTDHVLVVIIVLWSCRAEQNAPVFYVASSQLSSLLHLRLLLCRTEMQSKSKMRLKLSALNHHNHLGTKTPFCTSVSWSSETGEAMWVNNLPNGIVVRPGNRTRVPEFEFQVR